MGSTPSKQLKDRPTVVIVGGGYAGKAAAVALDKNGQFNVIVFNDKAFFHGNLAAPRAVVDGEVARQTLVPYDRLLKHGAVVSAKVTAINLDSVEVEGLAEPVRFDYLIIATGSTASFPFKIDPKDAQGALDAYTASRKAVEDAKSIAIIGGGASGCELAGEIVETYQGKSVTVIHSGATVLSSVRDVKDDLKKKALEQLRAKGVKVILGERVNIERKGAYDVGHRVIETNKGTKVEADLVFYSVGPVPNTASLGAALQRKLTEKGRIKVNQFLQVDGQKNVFAIGDVADIERQMAFMGGLQGQHVAKNIALIAADKAPKEYSHAPPLMLVSIGRTGGVAQMPGGLIFGAGVSAAIKSKTLFIPQTLAEMGFPKGIKPFEGTKDDLKRRQDDIRAAVAAAFRLPVARVAEYVQGDALTATVRA